jgi:hypothetical protein
MDDTEQQADHTDDPREQGTGQGGYPESNPEGAEDQDAEGGTRDGDGDDAPSSSSEHEGDPGQATGNPDAAG